MGMHVPGMGHDRCVMAAGLASVAVLALLLPFGAQDQAKALQPETGQPSWPGTLTNHPGLGDGDLDKFEDGFYEQVLDMQGPAGWQRSTDSGYHGVIIVVAKYDEKGMDASAENRDAMVSILRQAGARSIEASGTLPFVTASVPVEQILALSGHEEVRRLGDGGDPSTPAIDAMRATVGATADDLRRAGGMVTNGSGVAVGVLDFGINHPLGINDKVIGRIACDEVRCSSADAEDVVGPGDQMTSHGTRVALIIAGSGFSQNNGIAPGVDILDAGIGSHGFPNPGAGAISHGIGWLLRNNADVSNLSMGSAGCNGVSIGTIRQLITADAVESGMVLAVASGNDGSRGSGQNLSPVYNSISDWGCSHNVITVGGIDDRNPDSIRMYYASSRGPGSHLVNGTVHPILKPEIVAPASGIEIPEYTTNGDMGRFEGTSFAAPAATAAAALVLQERGLNPAGVKAALLLGANWTGPVPCTSVQFESSNASDDCSHKRQPTDFEEANGGDSLKILNNVGFGILDAGMAVDYAIRSSGSHLVEGSLDSDSRIDGYAFEATGTGVPVKIILSWTTDLHYEGPYSPRGENYFADLGFTVDCPGMETVSAQSTYQANEFAVFTSADAGTCTVAVTGSGIDTPRRSQQDYALASTIPLEAVDIERPDPAISTSESSPTNAYSITFTADFGEPVDPATFTASDISASGGTVSEPVPVNGTARAFTFAVSALPAGSLAVSIPEGGVLDPAGNNNTASDPYVVEIERTRPSPTLSTAEPSPVNASSITFTADFGEPADPATFTASDISVSGGTVSEPLPADGTARAFTFTVSALPAGNLTVSIPEGGVLDPAGNNNTASDPYVVEIERPRPSPTLSTAGPSLTNAYSITFTADFGEPVDPATFTASDISASGGTVSEPLPADGTARAFTFAVSALPAGNLTVSIPEGGVLDPVGQTNTASDPHVVEIERTRPAPTLSTAEPSPVNASSVTFTADFGEPVDPATFTASDISASGGTVSEPLPADGTTRAFTFAVSNLAYGSLAVSIPEGGVLDLAGNGNTASNQLAIAITITPAGTTPDAAFVTTWQTTEDNESITITPRRAAGTYTVVWGDAAISTNVSGYQTHVYKKAGTYTVGIYGDFTQIHLPDYPSNSLKLQSIEQWGDIRWESMRGAFAGALNMVYRATDAPDLSAVTDMHEMFRFAPVFNGNLSNWDVSSVTDMSGMFAAAAAFNGDISNWDVSAVTDMSNMFEGHSDFAQNLGNWYIVLDDTTMSGAGGTLAISAQNAYLDGQGLIYETDDARFVVADGELAVKPGMSVLSGTYNVTITTDGVPRVAHGMTHSKTILVIVEDDAAPLALVSAAYSTGNGTLTATFSKHLNGTVHYDRLHIRDADQSSGGISLDEAISKDSSGSTVTVTLAVQQQTDFARMATPQLDIDQGAVSDARGSEIAVAANQPIEAVTDPGALIPTVESIARGFPVTHTTDIKDLVFDVTFSEPVTGVDRDDFVLTLDDPREYRKTTHASMPLLPIPFGTVIRDSITVAHPGTVASVSVIPDITHTFIGDLRLSLISPDGTFRVLHNRAGGAGQDIHQTYEPDFGGVDAAGDWTLRIRDYDLYDLGVLNGWAITITYNDTGAAAVTGLTGNGTEYSVAVSAILDGTYSLALAPDNGISDLDGNPLASPVPTGGAQSYVAITGLPAVESVTRSNGAAQTTAGHTLAFDVAFSEPVMGVAGDDFLLTSDDAVLPGRFSQTSTPSLVIPDASRTDHPSIEVLHQKDQSSMQQHDAGRPVLDTISVPDYGPARAVSVNLNITHPYSGDLKVDLISPDGKVALLHNVPYASAANVVGRYAADLDGVRTAGDWTLGVRDFFAGDTGVLHDWTLEVEYDDTGAAVAGLTGNGTKYSVAVSVTRNGTYNLALAPYSDISDLAGNPLASLVPTGGNQSYTVDMTTALEVAGVVLPGAPQNLRANSTHDSVTLAWDPPDDDSIIGYRILSVESADRFSVLVNSTNSTAASHTVEGLTPSTAYAFAVVALNEHGGSNQSSPVDISTAVAPSPNSPPAVDAGSSLEVQEGSEASLSGTASDTDGDPLTYLWSHNSTLVIALDNSTTLSTAFTAPLVDANTTVTFTLTADDGTGTASDTVEVTILDVPPVNAPPTVDAGTTSEVSEGSEASLSGTASDPDGDPLTYLWSHNSTLAIALDNSTTLSTAFTAPLVDANTTVTFTLTADDGTGTASDTVEVTILDVPPVNAPPTVDAGTASEVSEGSEASLSGTASDPDGDPLTYLWSHNSTLAIALDNSTTLSTAFTAPLVDANTTVTFTLTADDGTGTASDTVEVTILDVPDNELTSDAEPTQTFATLEPTLPLGSRDIGRITLNGTDPGVIVAAWDAPSEAPVDYRVSWAKADEPFLTWTDLTGNAFPAGASHTITDLDEGEEYKVMVRARYGGSAGDWSGVITVTVLSDVTQTANAPPTVEAGSSLEVSEGSEASLSGTASDPDGDPLTYLWSHNSTLAIALDNSTTLSTAFTAPLVDANTTVTFTLTADDGTGTASDTVEVTILDVPDNELTSDAEPTQTFATLEPTLPLGSRDIGRITLNGTDPGVIVAAWDAPSEAPVDYRVSWAKADEPFLTWTDLTGNAFPVGASHTITDLDEGEEYKVMMRARYGGSAGDWSGVITVTVARTG